MSLHYSHKKATSENYYAKVRGLGLSQCRVSFSLKLKLSELSLAVELVTRPKMHDIHCEAVK